ncbi:dTDP-4-amino-4,6-dideoxygalactose transaminase [Thiohalospira halophila DSM 15071]|uniref:dTDP-4-amino-4,6-dideoxygalactose transaminase n=1 Tax=Thiohalospira halophila DSM 15071 TaxID=1123397 RepID=A0A1I1WF31_9GAMM|nr:DegT/DnrJ/EryC1/StrS family aminotransferase [Thiohalospira halophila]SFD92998.1 dTDP-4-amino-4,6-dideoxygalactose transaminase [Thiohalospira halophila DSM 15071]
MTTVGRPYLPNRKKLEGYLDQVYESQWLTNNGPLVRELEERLGDYLGVDNLLLVANGTLALEVALRTFGISGEAVSTPFTFVATSAAIRNEGLGVRYADIDPETLNLDPAKVESACGPDTQALVPVHVYGNPCDVEGFDELARRKGLKTVYDAAHALGVNYDGHSVLRWGDAATLSLHATKLFHTGEGGAVVFRRAEDHERARRLINFGLEAVDGSIPDVGMNAKMSEFHAAVGLAMLDDLPAILEHRKAVGEAYERELDDWVSFPAWSKRGTRNGAYAPILLETPSVRDKVKAVLQSEDVIARSYFSPSLDETAAYRAGNFFPESQAKALRTLCLPINTGMDFNDVKKISLCIKRAINQERE